MNFQAPIFSDSENLEEFKEAIVKASQIDEVKSLLIYVCDENHWSKDQLELCLNSSSITLFGGIFPQIIYKSLNYQKGFLIVPFKEETKLHLIHGLDDDDIDFNQSLENIELSYKGASSFVFVDGLSKRISELVEALYFNFGVNTNYIGGGAGSLSFEQKECVFTNQGVYQSAAVFVEINSSSAIGVSHGWKKLAGPYRVSHSNRNIIHSLDDKPALDVYKTVVEEASSTKIDKDNFFDIAKSYPFGLSKMDDEMIVRDPLTFNESDLICVGEVPAEQFVNILTANEDELIRAAQEAHDIALENSRSFSNPLLIMMDCISRVLFLEDNFKKEIEVVEEYRIPLVGALCLGEIANTGEKYLEFYNKTCVVARLDAA